MPSLEELTARFESTCDKIQDSILIIEANMGEDQEFGFNMTREIYNLASIDISFMDNAVDRYIKVLEEYKRVLNYKKKSLFSSEFVIVFNDIFIHNRSIISNIIINITHLIEKETIINISSSKHGSYII